MSRRGYVCNAATWISRETFLFPSLIQAVGEGLDLSVTMMPKRISEDARFSVIGVSLSLLTSIGRHQIRRSCVIFFLADVPSAFCMSCRLSSPARLFE